MIIKQLKIGEEKLSMSRFRPVYLSSLVGIIDANYKIINIISGIEIEHGFGLGPSIYSNSDILQLEVVSIISKNNTIYLYCK